jgi:hypothetical protein
MRLFEAAGIFHPRTLASVSIEEARRRLNLLRVHPHFNVDPAIEALVAELAAVKVAAVQWSQNHTSFEAGTAVEAKRDARFLLRTKGKIVSYAAEGEGSYLVEFEGAGRKVQENIRASCVGELPFSVLYYFKQKKAKFPAWFAAAKILALMQPTSAAAERVFSLLEAYFAKGGRRGSSLADLISTTIKMKYHGRKV